jgi:hypothetical protein
MGRSKKSKDFYTSVSSSNHDNAIVFMYALLVNKSKVTYTDVLHETNLTNSELAASLLGRETIACDFRMAIIIARGVYFRAQRRNWAFFSFVLVFSKFYLSSVSFFCWQSRFTIEIWEVLLSPDRGELKTEVHQLISLAFVTPNEVPSPFDFL